MTPSLLLIRRQGKLPPYDRGERIFQFLKKSKYFDSIVTLCPKPGLLLQGSYPPFLWLRHVLRFKNQHKKCFDVCWIHDPPVAAFAEELKMLRLARRFVYDEGEFCATMYSGLTSRLVQMMEIKAVRNVDLLTTLSEELRKVRIEQGAKASKIEVIPNGVDYRFFMEAHKSRIRRIQLSRFRPRTLVYMGQLRFLGPLPFILKEVIRKRPDVIFLIAGFGELPGEFYSQGVMGNVRFLGSLPYTEMPALLSAGDVGLAILVHRSFRYGVPTKMPAYAAAGLPMVTLDVEPLARFVNERRIGRAAKMSIGDIVEAILDLLDLSAEDYMEISSRATEYAKNYDWPILLKKHEELIFEKLVKNYEKS